MDARCPRKLNKTPCQGCGLGKESVDRVRKGLEPTCEWFVADAESNFCFWKFMEDRGDGRPIPPSKIAKLLMIDDSQVNKIVGKFKKEFHQILEPGTSGEDTLTNEEDPDDA